MRLKAIVILVSALLTSCTTSTIKPNEQSDAKPKFNYVIEGGQNWGVVQAFTSSGKTHVQFLDIGRANPIFLDSNGAEINYQRVGMYAILATTPHDFYIASSFGRAHVSDRTIKYRINALPIVNQSPENNNISAQALQQKIDELTAEKKELDKQISEKESAALLAKKQLDELQLVTNLLSNIKVETFLGDKGTVINRIYFDDFSTNVMPSILSSDVVLNASKAASKIVVRGFTDSKTSTKIARDLAASRSVNAKDFLVSHGIEASKVSAYYRSANNFIVPNDGDHRRFNRRVEITYYFPSIEG